MVTVKLRGLQTAHYVQAAVAGALRMAERSYMTSEVRASGLECQAARAQEQPKSYRMSEVRGGSLEELPCVQGQG